MTTTEGPILPGEAVRFGPVTIEDPDRERQRFLDAAALAALPATIYVARKEDPGSWDEYAVDCAWEIADMMLSARDDRRRSASAPIRISEDNE